MKYRYDTDTIQCTINGVVHTYSATMVSIDCEPDVDDSDDVEEVGE